MKERLRSGHFHPFRLQFRGLLEQPCFDWGGQGEATESEVEEWVRRWKRGEERRALVTDESISRGWEVPAVMVIGISDTKNLVMRTCGFCYLIKVE